MTFTEIQYQKDCTSFFAPADEIAEALRNKEGILGLSYSNLIIMIKNNEKLKEAVQRYL
jgi:hypothetical protein